MAFDPATLPWRVHYQGYNACILGDPGADSGDEEKSKRAEKCMARRKVKNGEKSPWGQCLTRPVPNGRRRSGFWLVPENLYTVLRAAISYCCENKSRIQTNMYTSLNNQISIPFHVTSTQHRSAMHVVRHPLRICFSLRWPQFSYHGSFIHTN